MILAKGTIVAHNIELIKSNHGAYSVHPLPLVCHGGNPLTLDGGCSTV